MMNQLSNGSLRQKMTESCKKICRYSVGHECDLTLSLYADDKESTPVCSHRFHGGGRHRLLATVAVAGSVILLLSLLGALKRLLCRLL